MEYMREHGQTKMDMKGHNLVYLHVNYNTFRLVFWTLSNLIEHKNALMALNREISELVLRQMFKDSNSVQLSINDLESMKVLGELL